MTDAPTSPSELAAAAPSPLATLHQRNVAAACAGPQGVDALYRPAGSTHTYPVRVTVTMEPVTDREPRRHGGAGVGATARVRLGRLSLPAALPGDDTSEPAVGGAVVRLAEGDRFIVPAWAVGGDADDGVAEIRPVRPALTAGEWSAEFTR